VPWNAAAVAFRLADEVAGKESDVRSDKRFDQVENLRGEDPFKDATVFGGPEIFNYVDCQYARKVDDRNRTRGAWRRLESIVSRSEPALRLEARGLALQLMAPFIVATCVDRPSESFSAMGGVVAYVDAQIHRRISVDELARTAHLERSYFSKLFKKYTGSRPSEYIKRRRIHLACEYMMWETSEKFASLARRLGFADAFHFSRVFKRVTGVSPKEFRRNPKLAP
jgi:AraC-like DNA-binding protein